MPKNIQKDHGRFRQMIGGKLRKELQKHIKQGTITKHRGKNGKIMIPLPRIDLPRFRYGKSKTGVGRGEGKPGDVIGRDDKDGKGDKAGQGHSEGIEVAVDQNELVRMFGEELQLPRLKPKPSQTFEDVKKRYTSESRNGPRALLNMKKTMLRVLRRSISQGLMEKKLVPGFTEPRSLLTPIKDDFRYRQYVEHKIPASNALIVFGRDGSGSMTADKCEIISDMSYWIDLWIRSHYKRTERLFIWHDSEAKEVDEDTFYKLRMGGGTTCSSCPRLVSDLLRHRYPVEQYNVYFFYFTDGENWGGDNEVFCKTLREDLGPDRVNFCGVTQVKCWDYRSSLGKHVEQEISEGKLDEDFVRTAYIGGNTGEGDEGMARMPWGGYGVPDMTEQERAQAIMRAIKALLGPEPKKGSPIQEVAA